MNPPSDGIQVWESLQSKGSGDTPSSVHLNPGVAIVVRGGSVTIVEGSGLTVEGSGLIVEGSGLTVEGSGRIVEGSGLIVEGSGLTVEGSGCSVEGEGPGVIASVLSLSQSGGLSVGQLPSTHLPPASS